MEYNTITLPNGLRVIHLHSQSPVVYCGYEVCAGTRDERNGEEGIAHFCEHVTFKGTEHRTAMQILNRLESVGGELNAFTNKEDTVYYSAILKEHFPRAVDLLTDIVFFSTYPQHEINKEVEVICDEIESYNDSPADLIYDDFENIVFHGHPLGHNILGTTERVRSFTTADALRFTSRLYTPSNAVFFMYGGKKLPTIPIGSATLAEPRLQKTAISSASLFSAAGETTRDKGTHQAHVMLGSPSYGASDDLLRERMSLYLLNNIIGGRGMNSRLNVTLREHRGLVYTVESSMTTYGDTGLWCTYLGCDKDDVRRCLRLVRRELDKFMDEPLSERRLNAAKKQLRGQLTIDCDNRENFALDLGSVYLFRDKARDVEKTCKEIDAVTAEDIQRVARHIFEPSKMTTLIYK